MRAVDVFATELARIVGAVGVTFLIADLSGDTLIRLPASEDLPPAGTGPAGRPAVVPLAGSPYEQAVRSQRVFVEPLAGPLPGVRAGHRAGDALGVLELTLPEAPDDEVLSLVASAAARPGVRRHRQPAAHRPVRVGPAHRAVLAGRGDPAPAAARRLHLRGRRSSPSPAGWSRPATSAATPSTTALDRDTLHLSHHRRDGAHASTPRCWRRCWSAACATAAARGADLAEQAPRGQRRRSATHAPRGSSSPGCCCGSTCRPASTTVVNAGHPLAAASRDGGWARSSWQPTCRSGMLRGPRPTACSRCRSSPATGWCCSPTACWSATPTTLDSAGARREPRAAPARGGAAPRADACWSHRG